MDKHKNSQVQQIYQVWLGNVRRTHVRMVVPKFLWPWFFLKFLHNFQTKPNKATSYIVEYIIIYIYIWYYLIIYLPTSPSSIPIFHIFCISGSSPSQTGTCSKEASHPETEAFAVALQLASDYRERWSTELGIQLIPLAQSPYHQQLELISEV